VNLEEVEQKLSLQVFAQKKAAAEVVLVGSLEKVGFVVTALKDF